MLIFPKPKQSSTFNGSKDSLNSLEDVNIFKLKILKKNNFLKYILLKKSINTYF